MKSKTLVATLVLGERRVSFFELRTSDDAEPFAVAIDTWAWRVYHERSVTPAQARAEYRRLIGDGFAIAPVVCLPGSPATRFLVVDRNGELIDDGDGNEEMDLELAHEVANQTEGRPGPLRVVARQ
jgi:hypothetical protein